MSALLAALYLQLGVAAMQGPPQMNSAYCDYWRARGGDCLRLHDINRPANPYAIVAVGFESDGARRWSAALELRHLSSVSTGSDVGQNTIELRVKWKPFNK